MTLLDEVTLLDPFAHTEYDRKNIWNFNFIQENSTTKREKVMIDQSFCTLVTVGGKFLEKKTFIEVLKMVEKIRRVIRE